MRKWRARFAADGLEGLVDRPRSGAPRTITDEQVEALVARTLRCPPAAASRPHGACAARPNRRSPSCPPKIPAHACGKRSRAAAPLPLSYITTC
ncbi:helix-turn-helix domain-containing protein [Streptomyces sp. NPDC001315]|uniref:helix-turn-helix domain-containing protein n=1 Tax=Streptomyces sp. NPDC001315 TaxID=3364562 RepID=UPI0036B20747